MKRQFTHLVPVALVLAALMILLPSLSISQTWQDTLQYAKVTGIGISLEGYAGDSLNNAIVEQQIRSRLNSEKLGRKETSPQRVGTVFIVTTTSDAGEGSLRKAIADANTNPGLDMISFNIPPAGPKTITPLSKLPNIVDPIIIDGTTQPGFVDKPMIEINCSSQGPFNALDIYAGNSTVRGLVINRLTGGTAIVLWTNGGNVIEGNFIGTDITGAIRIGNSDNGVVVQSPNNRIGGTTAQAKNVFAGHGYSSIALAAGSGGDLVQGNFIGTDVTGTVRLGNLGNGIIIVQGSANETIGGTVPGARNIISASGEPGSEIVGLAIDGTGPNGTGGIQVLGNYIGTDVNGTTNFGNDGSGILIIDSANNVIGGTVEGARNVISGNRFHGIEISESSVSSGNVVQGNFIGTKANGTDPLGNDTGIFLGAPNNTIGGTVAGAGNVISGNTSYGVVIQSSNATANKVQGNFIGTNIPSTLDLGNGLPGILISVNASQNTIGGRDAGARNIIAYNKRAGVRIVSGTNNLVSMNSIFSNPDGLGIDLIPRGLARNDLLDGDVGPNNFQNFPLLDSARVAGGNTIINGRLNSVPNATFIIDFYQNSSCDLSHFGQGEQWIGSTSVTSDANGNKGFRDTLKVTVPSEYFITATATDNAGNTSEFSQCLCLADRDGDAIMDCWETEKWGIDANSDSLIDLDLYALGARPDHKDIFVEVDAMVGLVPPRAALDAVVTAFGRVPNSLVNNPDRGDGIKLYYELDHVTIPAVDFPNTWIDFDTHKESYFGTQVQRDSPNSRYILEAKTLAYRYCIFARTYGTGAATFSSGLGELANGKGGNDFIVTLGSVGPMGWNGGTVDQQAGTFMHEMGHTLGLWHGGNIDQYYNPNYISVMNYTWQVPFPWQTPGSRRLNYSPVALPTLNESSLDERVGLNPPRGAYPIISVPYTDLMRVIQQARLQPATSVDWTGNGPIDSPSIPPVDINLVGELPAVTNPGQTLNGYADWPNLVFNFRDSPDFRPGVHTRAVQIRADDEPEEMTREIWERLNNLPLPRPSGQFNMDGQLDNSAVLLTSNGGINLYAALRGPQLYVATNAAQSQGADMFMFVSDTSRPLLSAPRAKSGQVAAWSAFIDNESTDNSSSWYDASASDLTNITVDTAGTVLEGVIDVEYLLGRSPSILYLAVGKYQTNDGGTLLAQAPAGNGDGNIDASEFYTFVLTTEVKENPQSIPISFALHQSYPNPFNPSTTIRYDLPIATHVSLKVYNVFGQEVATLVNETKSAGRYAVDWNATGVASGVYFYRLQAGDFVETRKLLLLR